MNRNRREFLADVGKGMLVAGMPQLLAGAAARHSTPRRAASDW